MLLKAGRQYSILYIDQYLYKNNFTESYLLDI